MLLEAVLETGRSFMEAHPEPPQDQNRGAIISKPERRMLLRNP
jgi:hypothetical protein